MRNLLRCRISVFSEVKVQTQMTQNVYTEAFVFIGLVFYSVGVDKASLSKQEGALLVKEWVHFLRLLCGRFTLVQHCPKKLAAVHSELVLYVSLLT